ncbi:hypothetical protein [Agrobacterium sp. 22-226-1]
MRSKATAFSIFALIAGCGTAPDTNDVASFGTATTNAVSVIGETGNLENELAIASVTQRNACRYLQSRTYNVASERADSPATHLVEQAKFLAALSDYAEALAKVSSPDAIAKLRAAATQLTTSATQLLTAASAAAPGAAVVAPVFKAGVDSTIYIGEARRMREVREIAFAVHPLLVDVTFIILSEDEEDRRLLTAKLATWDKAARCSLAHIRTDSGAAYEQFMAIDRAKREFHAREATANRRVSAITKVQAAHKILAEGGRNLRSATEDINMFLDDVAGLKAAIAKGGKSQ